MKAKIRAAIAPLGATIHNKGISIKNPPEINVNIATNFKTCLVCQGLEIDK